MGFLVNYKGRRAFQWHIRGNQMMNTNPQKGKECHDKALQMYTEAYQAGCREGQVVMAYATLASAQPRRPSGGLTVRPSRCP